MRVLHQDEYYRAAIDDAGVVFLTRSDAPWPDLDTAKARTDAAVSVVRAQLGERRGPGMVMDFRLARSRNDESFESTMAEYRDAVSESFERVAVVVRTTVGRLQINRLNQDRANAPQVFDDLGAARAWVQPADS